MSGARTVVVTGAAGAIGAATVGAFCGAGFDVVALDVNPAVLTMFDATVTGVVCDLGAVDSVAVIRAVVAGRTVAHVVGVAGGAVVGEPAAEMAGELPDPVLFAESVDANLVAQYRLLWATYPALCAAGGDRSVTFCSSVNATVGFGMAGYSAAKAGLSGLVVATCGLVGAVGIRVNAVAPGTVVTARTEAEWAGVPGHFEAMCAGVPLGRLGVPADVAATFVAVACDLTHMSGQVLVVDGGQTVGR